MKFHTFHDLFVDQLRDIFDAEHQILEALPKLIKAAENKDLKEALKHHLKETKNQVTRLQQIFSELGLTPKHQHCKGIEGVLSEGDETLKSETPSAIKDAAIIASAQRVEHYEIAVYGTLRTFAKLFGYDSAYDLLTETLKEESHADKTLSAIAEGGFFSTGINEEAETLVIPGSKNHRKKRSE